MTDVERDRAAAFEAWVDGVRGQALGPLEGFRGGWDSAIEYAAEGFDRAEFSFALNDGSQVDFAAHEVAAILRGLLSPDASLTEETK